ncbi:hypothetical protein HK097_006168 [Rhizophlyctis rosea]|uniref:Kinesin motor domain-containing protein n=1 Tax=Rhizophlyctis rosea TaxID=64517 RepID=A0AAD5SKA4_9FUNG|nr:hypothetical protein HK097_006168 [Rhizophlyctis rosea]
MCVEALRENQKKQAKRLVVPWRESRLTQLLQPYFEHGQARFLVHVNPDIMQAKVTAKVLRFAQTAGALHMAKAKGKSGQESEISEKAALQIRVHELEQELAESLRQAEDQEWEIRRDCNEEMQRSLGEAEARWRKRREEEREGLERLMDQKLDLAGREIERLTRLLKQGSVVEQTDSDDEMESVVDEVATPKGNAQRLEETLQMERRTHEEAVKRLENELRTMRETVAHCEKLRKENERLQNEMEDLRKELREQKKRKDVDGIGLREEVENDISSGVANPMAVEPIVGSDGDEVDFSVAPGEVCGLGPLKKGGKGKGAKSGKADVGFMFGGGGDGGDDSGGWFKPLKSGKVGVGGDAKAKKRRALGKSQLRLNASRFQDTFDAVDSDEWYVSQQAKKPTG